MKIIEDKGFRKLVADEGKQIRDINDIAYVDETGVEHEPYYTTVIFLAKNFDESKVNELYIEE